MWFRHSWSLVLMSHVEHFWILSPHLYSKCIRCYLFMVGMTRGKLLQQDKPVAAYLQGADGLICLVCDQRKERCSLQMNFSNNYAWRQNKWVRWGFTSREREREVGPSRCHKSYRISNKNNLEVVWASADLVATSWRSYFCLAAAVAGTRGWYLSIWAEWGGGKVLQWIITQLWSEVIWHLWDQHGVSSSWRGII